MESKNENQKMPIKIEISDRPSEIITKGIEINQGQCFINSWRVANKNESVEIVEGIILPVDESNGSQPLAHIWNKKGEIHFDVTRENIWEGKEEMKETKEIRYLMVKSYPHTEYSNGDLFEFSDETQTFVEEIKIVFEEKSKSK
jgi:hypothetical protein